MKKIFSTLPVLFALAISYFGASTVLAVPDSISVVPGAPFVLFVDNTPAPAGVANIGDILSLDVYVLNPADDPLGCATSLSYDLTEFGYVGPQPFDSCNPLAGPGGSSIYHKEFTLLEGTLDSNSDVISVNVTLFDIDDNIIRGTDTFASPIDNIFPVVDSVGTLSITTDNGIYTPAYALTGDVGFGVAALNDGATNQDKVTQNGASVVLPDGDTLTIDLTALTGEAALLQGTESGVVVPGLLDNETQSFILTCTDNAGNTVTALSTAISVDNKPQVITDNGVITITTDNGVPGVAGVNNNSGDQDRVRQIGVNYDDLLDMETITVDLTDLTGEPYVWSGLESGPVIPGPLENGGPGVTFTITVLDDAGNMTIGSTDFIFVDNTLPEFAAVLPVRAIANNGGDPWLNTNLWYYYDALPIDHMRTKVSTSSTDAAKAKMCIKALRTDDPDAVCSLADFYNTVPPLNYVEVAVPGMTFEFDYDLSAIVPWPSEKAGYAVNFQIEDDGGNTLTTSNASETLTGVFNINPKLDNSLLNNAGTTDFVDLMDFTEVYPTFRAEDTGVLLGELAFLGSVNLADIATATALQNFSTNVMVGGGDSADGSADIGVNAAAFASLNQTANLTISVPGAASQPGMVVYDDTGAPCGSIANNATGPVVVCGHNITLITWDGVLDTLSFRTDGFSFFGADSTNPTAVITPANGATGVATNTNIVVTFSEEVDTASFAYTLVPNPGALSVVWSGGNTIATISHTAFAAGGSYTFTITGAKDLVGNDLTGPGTSAFATAATPTTTSSSGNAGGRREGSNLGKVKVKNPTDTTGSVDTTSKTNTSSSYAGYATQFTDIAGHWGANYIKQLESEGYLNIPEDKMFKPDEFITRAAAAKLIAMWMNDDIPECTEAPYTDVSCDEPYAKYAGYLKDQKVMLGYMDGSFKPDEKVSREDALKKLLMAKILMATSILDVLSPFSDVKLGDWFYDVVIIGYKLNIVQGYPDGTFKPENAATRAEFAKMFVKTLL